MLKQTMEGIKYVIEKVILTWQFITLMLLFILLPTLRGLLENAESIKGQGFEVTFKRTAFGFGLMDSDINKLNQLSYSEMEVFLIKGGEKGDQTEYKLNWLPNEDFATIHRRMDSLGLIKINWQNSFKYADGRWHIESRNTDEGKKLYRAVLSGIFTSFKRPSSH